MRLGRGIVAWAVAIAFAGTLTGCSSGPQKILKGSFAVIVGGARTATRAQLASAPADDPLARLVSAQMTISDVEARKSDGKWVPIGTGLPAAVDLLGLAEGGLAPLRPDLLPEGHYNALQLRISEVRPKRQRERELAVGSTGSGWVVMVPVDFSIAEDETTVVRLSVQLDRSLRVVGGGFEFEPEFDVVSVERDSRLPELSSF